MNESMMGPIVKAMYVWRMNQYKTSVSDDTKARLGTSLENAILEVADLILKERHPLSDDYARKLDAAMRAKCQRDETERARLDEVASFEENQRRWDAPAGPLPLIFGIINPGLLPLCFMSDG